MAYFRTAAVLSAAALGLSSCGNDVDEVPVEQTADADRTLVLTPAQQANYDALDQDAFQREYATYREQEASAAGASPTDTSPSAQDTAAQDMASPGDRTAGANGLRPRDAMDFAYLDRNDDGQLSVAEYAIWSVPVDPNEPKRNDQTKPYLTSDQANEAAQSFFYYDKDGNTYLSEQEFQAARAPA